jgi:23S rRNA (adenine2503-C2)-methyltransferase
VAEVVAAARDHARATGRRISYEVTLIDAINDTDVDAQALADLLRDDHAHVNLIPMNPVAHTPWRASPAERSERFAAVLRAAGLTTTIRRNRGQEVGAACGQLAAERAGDPAPAAVARRRDRLERESARALGGRRAIEPAPVGTGEG